MAKTKCTRYENDYGTRARENTQRFIGQGAAQTNILESADGQRFVLALLKDWDGFAVGADDDITKNKELMRRLSHRKNLGKRIPLAQVRSQLGLA
jgi:hypothetical protein